MRAEIPVDSTHAEYGPAFVMGPGGPLGALILALVCAIACYVALPSATFRTHAVLAIDGSSATLRPTLVRVAAEGALSKPVIVRAAATLLALDSKAPPPDLAERFYVATGTKGATSRQARLADAIASVTRADPGLLQGTLDISAAAPVAEQAARIADALAEAFMTQQDDIATQGRMRRDEQAAAHIETAKAVALAARQRLVALGGTSLDPVQARNAAAARTAAAETRLASIRAILASGSPPLSDRRDLPPVLAVPQATYLELKAQLAKDSETLGERHTTIIALQDGVKRAAATLSAEWKRLTRIAEADVVAAREREAVLRKGDAPTDASRRDALEDAQRAVRGADEALALVEKQRDLRADEASFRLIARAPVPKMPVGLSIVARVIFSALAGLGGLLLFVGLRALTARWGAILPGSAIIDPIVLDGAVPVVDPRPRPRQDVPPPTPDAPKMRFFDDDAPSPTRVRHPTRPPARPRREGLPETAAAPVSDSRDDADLVDAMRSILDAVDAIGPRTDAPPTVMVAANEDGLATTPVALALGRAAAERTWRVLLIEAGRPVPVLAAATDLDAEPILIDFCGALRIGLADASGSFILAPVLRDAVHLASDLARSRTIALIDDLASAFDLIIIDGGVAADAAAGGWTADAFVRVGSRASRRDDGPFCATFEVSGAARLATILPSEIVPEPAVVPAPRLVPRSITPTPAPSSRPRATSASASSPRRKIASR